MKKNKIMYITVAILCFFCFSISVKAEDSICFYKKINSDRTSYDTTMAYALEKRNENGKVVVHLYRYWHDGSDIGSEEVGHEVRIDSSFTECPSHIYYNVSKKGINEEYWSVNSNNAEKRYDLANGVKCYYQNDIEAIAVQGADSGPFYYPKDYHSSSLTNENFKNSNGSFYCPNLDISQTDLSLGNSAPVEVKAYNSTIVHDDINLICLYKKTTSNTTYVLKKDADGVSLKRLYVDKKNEEFTTDSVDSKLDFSNFVECPSQIYWENDSTNSWHDDINKPIKFKYNLLTTGLYCEGTTLDLKNDVTYLKTDYVSHLYSGQANIPLSDFYVGAVHFCPPGYNWKKVYTNGLVGNSFVESSELVNCYQHVTSSSAVVGCQKSVFSLAANNVNECLKTGETASACNKKYGTTFYVAKEPYCEYDGAVIKLDLDNYKIKEVVVDGCDTSSKTCFLHLDNLTFGYIYDSDKGECTGNQISIKKVDRYANNPSTNPGMATFWDVTVSNFPLDNDSSWDSTDLVDSYVEYEKIETYKPVCGVFKPEEAGGKLIPIIRNLYRIFKIALPVLIVILTIVEFVKVLFSGEDKTMKDALKASMTRLILLAVLILLPILIEFILRIAGLSGNCLQKILF